MSLSGAQSESSLASEVEELSGSVNKKGEQLEKGGGDIGGGKTQGETK